MIHGSDSIMAYKNMETLLKRAMNLLRQLQVVQHSDDRGHTWIECPTCYHYSTYGKSFLTHDSDCELANLLAEYDFSLKGE